MRIARENLSPDREWLEVDRRGGYSSGTLGCVPRRRYHGLLLIARHPPHQRMMLVNHLMERVLRPEGDVTLAGVDAHDAKVSWAQCESFSTSPAPTWRYRIGETVIERMILRARSSSHVWVRWSLLAGPPMTLHVRPMLTGRNDHDAQTTTDDLDTEVASSGAAVSWQPHHDFPRVYARSRGAYHHAPAWQRGIEYPIDKERGEASQEDWWCPGDFRFDLKPGESRAIAFSTEDLSGFDPDAALDLELRRRHEDSSSPDDTFFEKLSRAASSYFVDFGESESEDGGGAATLAGFPWFDVWTRDTFTSFTGLYLATGHFAEGRKVLATFAPLVKDGILPANFPDKWTKPRWNAADASLWFIVSVDRYLRFTRDDSVLSEFAFAAVCAILDGYSAGSPPHIRVDTDGLVAASAPDQALTWMDADYKGHVMTPRRGKPVEIQALWIHALGVAASMATLVNDFGYAARCKERRSKAVASFQRRFWNEKTGYLFDVIDGPEGDDATLRPNQIFALAFDPDLVPHDQAMKVLTLIDRRLRTPAGLRTLATDDPNYHPQYVGPQSERDPAYHQGTAWPFLLGPFVQAWLRLHDGTAEARQQCLGFLAGLEARFDSSGCLDHLSEIFDADAPHAARGCFAQAWSAGELLAALHEIRKPPTERPQSSAT